MSLATWQKMTNVKKCLVAKAKGTGTLANYEKNRKHI